MRLLETYRRCLRLYPKRYRDEYGPQMVQTLADMLEAQPTPTGRMAIWMRAGVELPFSALKQDIIITREVFMTGTPKYIKRYSAIGTILVAPFFLFIIANALSGQRLYDSLFWQTWILFTWIIVLPSLAILLNAFAFIKWIRAENHSTGRSIKSMVMDYKHSWPAVSLIVIGLAILAIVFGHDSVHCIGGSPIQEIANWHQTWQCLNGGFLGGR